MKTPQAGSAIWILFVAIALFGGLAYAMMQGSRTSTDWLTSEQGKATNVQTQDCTNSINSALQRLTLRGCGNKISYKLDGTNLNPGAPTDGSCSIFHVQGGGVAKCTNVDSACKNSLSAGQSCDGLIYVGMNAGSRIYTTLANSGNLQWGTGTNYVITSAQSTTDGKANTDTLVAAADANSPYPPANLCRTLGAAWYWPSQGELQFLYTNRAVGLMNGTITATPYWASNNSGSLAHSGISVAMTTGVASGATKNTAMPIRCIRKD